MVSKLSTNYSHSLSVLTMYKSLVYLTLLAPATTFAAAVKRTDDPQPDLPPASNLPPGWSYTGCYVDSPAMRVLPEARTQDDDAMTGELCIDFCAKMGYPVAGTEYSTECYCGLDTPPQSTTGCNMGCAGDTSQACGGPGTITVYENPSLMPRTNPGNDCWRSIGCYADSTSSRTLERRVSVPGGDANANIDTCTATCTDQGFSYAGLEYGAECWCGNALADSASSSMGCDMPCKGDTHSFCGGRDALNIYEIKPECAPVSSSTTSSTTSCTTESTTPVSTTPEAATTTPETTRKFSRISVLEALMLIDHSLHNAINNSIYYTCV